MSLEEHLRAHRERMARIDKAVSSVAKECGVTPTVVRVVWWNAAKDGSCISYAKSGPFVGRRPHKPRNLRSAVAAGAVTPEETTGSAFWLMATHHLTPLGRRILWRVNILNAGGQHENP